jgi:predicted alpha/beta hydrolase
MMCAAMSIHNDQLLPQFACRYHSIDEYALIDLPAQVNTALQLAGAKKLAIVGHSQVGS